MRSLRVALLLALLAGAAHADEGAEQRFSWRPSFETRSTVVDNAYLTPKDKQSDLGVWMVPRLELGYRTAAASIGADLGAEIPRYLDHSALNDTFWRARLHGEAGIWPGLSVRISDDYTPSPIALGAPDDATPNMSQTNRAAAELRYWRELPGKRELTLGIVGARFDGNRFETLVPGPGDDAVMGKFRPNFSEGGGYAELRNPIGEDHAVLLRGSASYRSFDSSKASEDVNAQGLLGLESRLPGGLALQIAGGFGWLDPRGENGEPQALGRAELSWQNASGLTVRLGFHHQFASDLVGNDFLDTSGRLSIEKSLGFQTSATLTAFVSQLDSKSTHPSGDLFGGAEIVLRRQLSRSFQLSLAYRYWENAGSFEADDFRQNQASVAISYRH
jgi:hypothetical protein